MGHSSIEFAQQCRKLVTQSHLATMCFLQSGILGDLLVIDRSMEPQHDKIAVCYIDGEFTVKRLKVAADGVFLIPENPKYQPIKVTEENELIIWGIVTYVVKKL